MTDKEKIKEEIEKEMRVLDLTNDFDNGRFSELNHLKLFIDSLPEEHNEDFEEEISNYIKDNFFGSKSMGFLSNRTKGELDSIDVVNIARHFAEWQKKQMMKDVVEVEVEGGSFIRGLGYKGELKKGDKVKLIIIKED